MLQLIQSYILRISRIFILSTHVFITISDRLDFDDLLLNIQRFGEDLYSIDLLLNNFDRSDRHLEDATIDFIINGCPKLKSLCIGSHSLVHSNLIIYEESLKDLSKRCKELKNLKIFNAKIRAEPIWKKTEGDVEEMFPDCNVEIKESEFISYNDWFHWRFRCMRTQLDVDSE